MTNNQLTSDDVLEFIKNNKKYLFDKYNLEKVGVFRSFAKNQQKPDSDIDLVIELKKNTKNIFEIKTELKKYFKIHFNRDIDIAREKYLKPRIKKEILKEVLYV